MIDRFKFDRELYLRRCAEIICRDVLPTTAIRLAHYRATKSELSRSMNEVPTAAIHEIKKIDFDINEPQFKRLVQSIRQHGQIVPGLLMPRFSEGQRPYLDLIYGRKRLAAARLLGLPFYGFIRVLTKAEAQILMEEERLAAR